MVRTPRDAVASGDFATTLRIYLIATGDTVDPVPP
jgi:hypothetical protein